MDEEEFGDLYTDVLQSLATSVESQHGEADAAESSQGRPIDRNVDSDGEEIRKGAPNLENSFSTSNSTRGLELNASIEGKPLLELGPRPERGAFDLNLGSNLEASRTAGGDGLEFEAWGLEKGEGVQLPGKRSGGVNFMEEDDDLSIMVEERENKDDDLVEKDVDFIEKQENMDSSARRHENIVNFMGPGAVGEMDVEQIVPGLSGKLENGGGSNFEDEWESDDSEDDFQIVLNDNDHRLTGMEGMPGVDDEDEEPLVIVADNGDAGHHNHNSR